MRMASSRCVHVAFAVLVLVGLASAAARAQPASAGRRVALVIGNGSYRSVDRLANPANDARLMARTLQASGFTLVGDGPQLDLSKPQFDRLVQQFGRALQGADVALFYYSGHGMQVAGTNWLVPVDANPAGARDLDFQAVDANLVLRQMEGAGTRLNLMILDACRNNPFAVRGVRASGGGLAEMRAPEGTLISYATQPGNVAADGGGANSPYTAALAAAMRQPGLDVFRVFNQVGLSVKEMTGGQQQPWLASSPISGNFYFYGPVTIAPTQASDEAVFWQSVQDSRSPADLQAYLPRYPQGTFAELAQQRLATLAAQQQAAQAPLYATPGYAGPAVPVQAGRGKFDGVWDVVLSCSRAEDGASGYTFRFAATVRGNVLRAEKGTPGQPGSLVLNGTIQPDGNAMLMANGNTGNPEYSVGRVSQTTPYSYRMQARFDEQRGTGTRLDTRPCTATFAKQ